MKKIIAVILILTIIFSFAGCDNVLENKTNNNIKTENSSITNSNNSKAEICAHVWGQWVEKRKATCQVSGIKQSVCHNCHITKTKHTEALAHKESDWIIDKVAEIGKDGLKYTKCDYCNKRMNEIIIPAITENHKHAITEWVTVKNSDCTNNGTQNAICSCGKTMETKEIPAKGHTTVIDKAVPATCTSNGLTEGSHCSVCNTVIVKQNSIDKLSHAPVIDKAVPATCKNTGLTEGKHCSACNKVIVAQTIVPKTDSHTSSGWIIDTEATCKAEGTRHKECTVCGKILKSDTIEKRTEHSPMVKDVQIANGLFCGDDGEYFAVVKCKDCGEKISEGKYNLPERHSMVNDVCEICGLPQSTTAGLRFRLNPDGKSYSVTTWNGLTDSNVVIGVYNGLSVTEMQDFSVREELNSIVIGDCVKKIGVFIACTNLRNVVIGNGVKEIPEEAFSDCTSLITITIGDNVEKIGKNAFYNCNGLYYAYISGAHDWRCSNMYNNNVTVYGGWIGKENNNSYFAARYLKKYVTYEWTRK